MNYKKTWFGWLNFTVGTLFMSVFIFTLLVSLFEFNGLTMSLFNFTWARVSFLVSIAFIIVIIGILIFLRFFKKKIKVKPDTFNMPLCKVLYFLGFIAVLALGIYLRREALLTFNENSVLNQAYYNRIVSCFEGKPDGTTDLFVRSFCFIYAFLLKVFGLSSVSLIVANYFFQILGAVFIALALKNLFGKTCSICAFGLIMLLSGPINLGLYVSPDPYIFAIVSFVGYLFALLLRDREDGLMESNFNVSAFVLMGLFYGALIYINPVLIILPIASACGILLLGDNPKYKKIAINRKILPTVTLVISSVVTAIVGFIIDSYCNNVSLEKLIDTYFRKIGFSGFFRIYYPDELIVVCLVILFLCLAAYINYIFAENDFISVLTFIFVAVYFVYAKNLIAFDTSYYLIVLLGAIMGIGLHSLFFEGYTVENMNLINESDTETTEESVNPEIEIGEETVAIESTISDETVMLESATSESRETNESVMESESMGDSESISTSEASESENNIASETIVIDSIEEPLLKDDDDESVVATEDDEEEYLFLDSDLATSEHSEADYVEASETTMIQEEVTEEVKEEVTETVTEEITDKTSEDKEESFTTNTFVPIENVLPLPKPHVKKSMGYAFEPGEKYMKFDYEISEDDDFDID